MNIHAVLWLWEIFKMGVFYIKWVLVPKSVTLFVTDFED